jgi:uncharacterized protein (DUF305 family)
MDDLSKGRLAAAALALAFLAGSLGFLIGTRSAAGDVPDRDSAEVEFLYDMIHHHEQALEMSSLELTNGGEPRILHFAREITQQQSYEIGVMQQLLRSWGYDPSEDDPAAHADMPGMASQAEMDALSDAEGQAADELFLRLMIAHHRGGAQMAAFASERADEPQVNDLAKRMARVQQMEIGEMTDAAETLGLDIGPAADSHDHGAEQEGEGHDH